jgi:hypothetical protein
MKKLQQALDMLFDAAMQNAKHEVNAENPYNEALILAKQDIQRHNKKLLQELIDEASEAAQRKESLVVGSQWECVNTCFGSSGDKGSIWVGNKVTVRHVGNKFVTLTHLLKSEEFYIESFLRDFKPVQKVEE